MLFQIENIYVDSLVSIQIRKNVIFFFDLLRVQFASFGGQPGSFPYSRLAARQCGKRRELCGSVAERHLRMVLGNVMRQVNDVIIGAPSVPLNCNFPGSK